MLDELQRRNYSQSTMSRPTFEVADIVRRTGNRFWEQQQSHLAWPHRKVRSAERAASHLARALPWHFGQCRLRQECLHHVIDDALPGHARQRGTNENTNGLLRQYLPKKNALSGYSQSDLDKVALRLNQRPRKTLGFETPASKLQAGVASTG